MIAMTTRSSISVNAVRRFKVCMETPPGTERLPTPAVTPGPHRSEIATRTIRPRSDGPSQDHRRERKGIGICNLARSSRISGVRGSAPPTYEDLERIFSASTPRILIVIDPASLRIVRFDPAAVIEGLR